MNRMVFAVALLLVLAGCGVRPTEVVNAGDAPDGIARGPVLFFVIAEPEQYRLAGDPFQVRPVFRETGSLGTETDALGLLAAGPTQEEAAAGFRSHVPGFAPGQVSVGLPENSIVTVQLPLQPSRLPGLAPVQLICTVVGVSAMSGSDARELMVRLTGRGESRPPETCPVTR